MNPLSLLIAILQEIVVPQQDDGTGSIRSFRKTEPPLRITVAERWFIADAVAGHIRITLFLALGTAATIYLLGSSKTAAAAAAGIILAMGLAAHRWHMRAIRRRLRTPDRLGLNDQTLMQRLDPYIGRSAANLVILPLLIAITAAALFGGFGLDIAVLQVAGCWLAAAIATSAWHRFLV